MKRELVKVGVRVKDRYVDGPHGTITEIINSEIVMVKYDNGEIERIMVKYLLKGV